MMLRKSQNGRHGTSSSAGVALVASLFVVSTVSPGWADAPPEAAPDNGPTIVPAAALESPAALPPASWLAFDPNLTFAGGCTGGGTSMTLGAGTQRLTGSFSGVRESNSLSPDPDMYWCSGHIPAEAQYCVTIPYAGSWTFQVTDGQSYDVVLALQNIDDLYQLTCDDDSGGNLLPMFNAYLPAGQYLLYVGAYSIGVSGQYTLEIRSN
jgi:hypothetical protein